MVGFNSLSISFFKDGCVCLCNERFLQNSDLQFITESFNSPIFRESLIRKKKLLSEKIL